MTIGVDIRVLARGTRTGIEEYTLNLLPRLLSLDTNIKFKLFYNAFRQVPLSAAWLDWSNVELKKFRYPNRFVFDPLAKFLDLPKIDKMLGGADIFFAPHFLLSPLSAQCRRVVTFHDLSFEYFPEFYPWRKKFWHAFLSPRQRASEAQKIIAVSESTKADLVDIYGMPEQKIRVIYSGVGEEFRKITNNERQMTRVAQKYNLPDKFILYFGTIEPRKNIVGLIRAYEILRREHKVNEYKLVIAGSRGWLDRKIFIVARQSPFAADIIFTNFVEPSEKVYLYNLASLFVYPSFFEGFGFPPLEAMSCGVPVICSQTSSFPEIVGSAVLLVDPYNLGEIAWAMAEILKDARLRELFITQGFSQAKNFSWDKCARETLNFLIS